MEVKNNIISTNGSHFPVFSEDVAFACHFVATCPPSHPIGVLVVLAIPVKISKMVGNPASYPVYSRYNELL